MKRAVVTGLALVFGTGAALLPEAVAQTKMTGGIRGKVLDEQGKALDGVKLDFEFKGESRQKITASHTTDKKGGFVRMGLRSGPWRIAFSKDGYQTYQLDTELSAGGFSEVEDVVLKVGGPAAAAAPAPAAGEVVPVLPPESGTMKHVYNNAVEASRAGNLDEAEALYKEIIANLPGVGEIHYNLGHIYVRKNDLASAEASFRTAVALQPQKPEAYIALQAIYASGGKTHEAADLMIQAAPSFEQDAKFQFVVGTACVNAGKSQEAAAAFRKVADLDPSNREAHFHLATLAVGENKVNDALAELQQYIAGTGQDPQNLATAKRLLDALKPRK